MTGEIPKSYNIGIAAKYIVNDDNIDRVFIEKVLYSNLNIEENKKIVDDILANKDILLKQLRLKCQNQNPNFVNNAEGIFICTKFQDLVFMPNLSQKTMLNNLFETSKIFYYVESKPQDYINGQYPKEIIDALIEYYKEGENSQMYLSLTESDKYIVQSIKDKISYSVHNRILPILDAISATDIETVKLLLDKRFNIFDRKLMEINELNTNVKNVLSDLIRNGKRINKKGQPDKLTGQQKIDMINIAKCIANMKDFDISKYKTPLKDGAFIIDLDRLHADILNYILTQNGIPEGEIINLNPDNITWSEKYLSLLCLKPTFDNGELSDMICATSYGIFDEYIMDPTNIYGEANLETIKQFKSNNVNFEQWEHPDIEDVEFEVAGKKVKIKLWNRLPQEDYFLGAKTSCCTAPDRTNGGATANYILNKSWNVVELYDEKGETVGMSRVFMSMIDGKPTLIMDNIELNHEFIRGMDYNNEIRLIRDKFFEYMNRYAEKITGDANSQVYFYSEDLHVPTSDLNKVDKTTEFLGEISRDNIYINSSGLRWLNPKKLKNEPITWLEVPRK